MSPDRTTSSVLWYPVCPALIFWASLRSWYYLTKQSWIQPTFIHLCYFPRLFTGIHIKSWWKYRLMSLLDHLHRRVQRLAVIRTLDAVVDAFKVLLNQQGRINLDISFADCCPQDSRSRSSCSGWSDAQGDCSTWLQVIRCIYFLFMEVHVLGGIDNRILECLVHSTHIVIYSPDFVVLDL